MSREQKYSALVVKKQPYGEGDELITFYTRQNGKLRGLAKSSKFSKSKLQYSLQTLFWIELTLTSGQLPKIIGAELLNSFASIRENLQAAKMSMYALELLLKFTPDEQKNEQLFDALTDFFQFLNEAGSSSITEYGLAKFKICFLDAVGLAVHADGGLLELPAVGFSHSHGGFTADDTIDYQAVTHETLQQFFHLRDSSYGELLALGFQQPVKELQEILSDFLHYHLERDIKSERFL